MFKNLLLINHKGDEAETWHTCLVYFFYYVFFFLLRNCKEDEAETWHTCIGHWPIQKLCFYSSRIRTLVAMATYSSHRLIMGKLEIDSFCCLTGDICFFFTDMFIG